MTDRITQALEALNELRNLCEKGSTGHRLCESIRVALSSAAPSAAEPVAPRATEEMPVQSSVVAGAVFDFIGWLTSHESQWVLSSRDPATPAVQAAELWAEARGLSLDVIDVEGWREALATPPTPKAASEPVAKKGMVITLCGSARFEARFKRNEALALLEQATNYTSCDTSSPSLTREIQDFIARNTPLAPQAVSELVAEPAHSDKNAEFADWMLHGIEISGEAATGFKLNPAARDVLVERQRQISVEGWTPEHDDAHSVGELARAAACYANPDLVYVLQGTTGLGWPWDESWWKPADQHRNLVKAGALILAAIARLYRAADKKES